LQALPNQQTVDYPSFKLVIVGDGGTGKHIDSLNFFKIIIQIIRNHVITIWTLLLSKFAGKTTFVKRHLTGEFEKKYERTIRY